jgi:hypothetical protein
VSHDIGITGLPVPRREFLVSIRRTNEKLQIVLSCKLRSLEPEVGLEPTTSALRDRSAEFHSVPMRPSSSRFRCSSRSHHSGGETRWDPAGRSGTQLLGRSWAGKCRSHLSSAPKLREMRWRQVMPNAAQHVAQQCVRERRLATFASVPSGTSAPLWKRGILAFSRWSGWRWRPEIGRDVAGRSL